MADFVAGDYSYTVLDAEAKTVQAKVTTRGSDSYEDIPGTVEHDGETYAVTNVNECFYQCLNLTTAPSIPNGVTSMASCFRYCTSLETPPTVPETVIRMAGCFYECTSLALAPSIPNGVADMRKCFFGCTSLASPPAIPNSVTYLNSCFRGCTSLMTAPSIPSSATYVNSCFLGCTSLTGEVVVANNLYSTEFGVFKDTVNPIIIIPDDLTANGMAVWREIAAQYDNVTFAAPLLDFHAGGDGVAVGTVSTGAGLEVAMDTELDGDLGVLGDVDVGDGGSITVRDSNGFNSIVASEGNVKAQNTVWFGEKSPSATMKLDHTYDEVLWWDTKNGVLKGYNGSSWVPLTYDSTTANPMFIIDGFTESSGTSTLAVLPCFVYNPSNNGLYYCT